MPLTPSIQRRVGNTLLLMLAANDPPIGLSAEIASDSDQPSRPTASQSVLDDPNDRSLKSSFEATYLYGPVGCYLQTPSGGQPGTTSIERPTLEELGIDDVSIYDTALALSLGRKEIYIGGQFIGLSGDATLDETLISQNITFPAGTQVEADIELTWYRVGYRYWFLFDTDDQRPGDELAIAPSVGAGCFDFSYKLDGPGDADVDRSYAKPTPQVGLEVEWRITNRFALVGGLLSSIPLADTPFIASTRVAARYRIIDARAMKLDALAGIGYERIQYDDGKKQEMPNDIDIDLGPLLLFGLKAEF